MFNTETINQLPGNEQNLLKGWNTAKYEFTQLQSFAIEGTTPASPVLFTTNPERRRQAEEDANADNSVFAMSAPNVFRSIKVLHVGGKSSRCTHTLSLIHI